jgi:hypothetical protein
VQGVVDRSLLSELDVRKCQRQSSSIGVYQKKGNGLKRLAVLRLAHKPRPLTVETL